MRNARRCLKLPEVTSSVCHCSCCCNERIGTGCACKKLLYVLTKVVVMVMVTPGGWGKAKDGETEPETPCMHSSQSNQQCIVIYQ
jgi:hypothetical protein